jgi:Ankyrin repeats (3 copies)
MRIPLFLLVVITNCSSIARAVDLSPEQRLILACHHLDILQVTILLRDGADVNARFNGNSQHFQDPWSGGLPIDASHWNPLLALANSSQFPPPSKTYENTLEHMKWVEAEQKKVPANAIAERSAKRVEILRILLSNGCDVDMADNHGATALYCAIDNRQTEFVELLLQFKPNVNTTTGTYIDNTSGRTPLHAAAWSPELIKLLIQHGADEDAKDDQGKTAGDYQTMLNESSDESVKKRLEEFKLQIEALKR